MFAPPGYIPIPKSINPERVLLNMADGFDLTKSQMELELELEVFVSCFLLLGFQRKRGFCIMNYQHLEGHYVAMFFLKSAES